MQLSRNSLIRFLLRRPFIVDVTKSILSFLAHQDNKLFRRYWMWRARKHAAAKLLGLEDISLETTLNCNSRCLMCYHYYKKLQGFMSMDLFKKIIDDCHQNGITTVGLSVYGEPFLDPYFFERVEYLRRYNMGWDIH